MTFSHALFVLLFCVLTGSFTWGMRGSILGGERGAMLPGAALAMVLLFAGGSAPVATAFPMAAVIGAAGMFFGGAQTYGETIGMALDSDGKTRLRGWIGLAVKGGGWFGVFGGVLGFGLGAFAGRYRIWETVLFVLLLPIMRLLGIMLINSPYSPKDNVFPKLYFSKTRREVWGGMLFVLLYILVFTACKGEWFAVCLSLFGLIFGAVGFFAGNLLQNYVGAHLSEKWFSAWKAMECAFGAIGAFGVGLCWCALYKPFVSRYTFEITAHSGAWSPLSPKGATLLGYIWLLLLGLFIARYWFAQPNGKKKKSFARLLYVVEDTLIWPVFCLYPLFLAAVGDLFFAQIFSFFGMFYLLPDKIVFGGKKQYEKMPIAPVLHIALIVLSAAALFAQLFLNAAPSAYAVFMVYTLAYLLVLYLIEMDPLRLRALMRKHGSFKAAFLSLGTEPTWLAYAGLCVIVLLILGKPYFSL